MAQAWVASPQGYGLPDWVRKRFHGLPGELHSLEQVVFHPTSNSILMVGNPGRIDLLDLGGGAAVPLWLDTSTLEAGTQQVPGAAGASEQARVVSAQRGNKEKTNRRATSKSISSSGAPASRGQDLYCLGFRRSLLASRASLLLPTHGQPSCGPTPPRTVDFSAVYRTLTPAPSKGSLAAFVATILQTAVEPSQLSVSLTATALLFLTIRAAGDDRRVGFTKTHRASAFGRADESVFTPLISVLAFGTSILSSSRPEPSVKGPRHLDQPTASRLPANASLRYGGATPPK